MKKRLLCMILTLVMIFSLVPSVAAASDEATEAAEALYELGLFKGTGTNPDGTPIFDLDKTPTRNQAIIMLVRLLGKEEEAKAGTWKIPFTDVSDSMKPYIGYAYTNGLTNGYTATTFGGTNPIRANQYITFVLRAMGYVSGVDFEVRTAWELSDRLGITNGQYNAGNADRFLRGDVAHISWSALSAEVCGAEQPLAEKLQAEGAIPQDAHILYRQDAAPADLTFRTIPKTEYGCWGYVPGYFKLKSIEYAPDGEYVYFRVHYDSATVQKFFVLPANWESRDLGEMVRYAAEPGSGVFTCRLPKAWFREYANLVIGPSEDGSTAPDYVIEVGYLQLTEDDSAPVFLPYGDIIDDSYEVPNFQFHSVERARVVGGYLYRVNFTNTMERDIQFWTVKMNQGGGWNTGLMNRVDLKNGDSSAYYYVPDYVNDTYDAVFVRVRDNPKDGSFQEHAYIDIYFHGLPKQQTGGNGQ